MVAPGRIFFSRPSSNRVLLGLKWREIYYLGGGVIAGIICSFYLVRSLIGLLSIVILPVASGISRRPDQLRRRDNPISPEGASGRSAPMTST